MWNKLGSASGTTKASTNGYLLFYGWRLYVGYAGCVLQAATPRPGYGASEFATQKTLAPTTMRGVNARQRCSCALQLCPCVHSALQLCPFIKSPLQNFATLSSSPTPTCLRCRRLHEYTLRCRSSSHALLLATVRVTVCYPHRCCGHPTPCLLLRGCFVNCFACSASSRNWNNMDQWRDDCFPTLQAVLRCFYPRVRLLSHKC